MTDVPKKQYNLKLWHVGIFGILCICTFGYLAMYLLQSAKTQPLQVDAQGLSAAQVAGVQQAIEPIGAVRFFTADLMAVHSAVSQLSWVKNAKVYRDWHRGIVVSVTPRIAIANYGSDQMLDADGVAFVPADSATLMNANMAYLYGRSEEADSVMRQMQKINQWFAPVNMRAKDLILTPRQTWIVVFDNGMRVVVDYEDTDQKLYNFAVQLNTNLAKDLPNIQSADLRYKNGFTIAYKKS